MSTGPRVSVVTPAYDEEDYLAECIESVRGQTYENWVYTIVNNCSGDRTLEIARDYAARDPRITVVDNESFLSQIDNLNRALSLADPEAAYVKMILADDRLYPRCLEEMVRVGEAHPRVGLISAWRQDDQVVNCNELPPPDERFDGHDIGRATLLDDLFVFGSPSTVMWRADLVRARQPFFDASALHEDTESCLEILRDHDLGYVHEVLTFTRRENESITTARNAFDPEHRLDRLLMGAKCGSLFLGEDEQRRRQDELMQEYYDFLGRRRLYRLPEGFWEYHRSALEAAGLKLDRMRFWVCAANAAWNEAIRPGRLWRRITRRGDG